MSDAQRNRLVHLLRRAAGAAVPNGIVRWRDRRRIEGWKREQEAIHASRATAIAALGVQTAPPRFDYAAAIAFLVKIGCDEQQVIAGSMDEESLLLCRQMISEMDGVEPLMGVHVGNFVGVSLSSFAYAAAARNAQSVVFSIDPNLVHRGIVNPAEKVIALLDHFALTANASVMAGYSLEKSVSNDGIALAGYDAIAEFARERACEHQLAALSRLAPGRFDFAVIDGNHQGDYFARELAVVDVLLRPNGLMFLDDISWQWEELRTAYDTFARERYDELVANGRILVARKTSGPRLSAGVRP